MINLNSLTKNIKDGFKAPTGDSNRETPTKGALRFNTETGKPEIYAKGRGWRRASVSEISAIYTHDSLVAFYDASNADTTGDTSDQYYSDVELLLHMNGTDGSTTFTDSGPNGYNPTSTGGAEISNSQNKFGGSSSYFNNSRLRYAGSVGNLDGSSNSWTIEMWVYPTISDTNNRYLLNKDGQHNVIVNAYGLYYSNGGIAFNYRNSAGNYKDVNSGGTSFNYNEWNHLAVVRDGSTSITIFLNGVQVGQKTTDLTMGYDSNRYLDIGTGNFNTVDHFIGYLDEVRITKGVARYTADFTPQTREFYPGTAVSDITSNNNDSLLNGPSLVTTQPKHYSFDGTNDFVRTLSDASNFETQTGTAIVWAYKSDWNSIVGSFDILVGNQRAGGSNGGWVIGRNGSNLIFEIRDGSSWKTISYALSNISSGWHQFAGIWNGSNIKLYVDANQESSDSYGGTITYQNWPVHIGVYYNNTGWYNGDLAIFKFYDSALSEADITSEFNYHKSAFGL